MKRGYKLIGFKEISPTVQKVHTNNVLASSLAGDEISVSDLFDFVKQNDKELNPKPVSGVVNEDGTPMIVYHGTDEEFNAMIWSNSSSTKIGDFKIFSKMEKILLLWKQPMKGLLKIKVLRRRN